MQLVRNQRSTILRRPRAVLGALILALVLVGGPGAGRALACACCAEPGMRHEGTSKVDSYTETILGDLRFSGQATLYTTACGKECVSGIDRPADAYSITSALHARQWRLEFQDPATDRTGTLSFTLPNEMTEFAADTAPEAGNGSATLYREWRLTAPVDGTGIFLSVEGNTAMLEFILLGTGNACPQIEDFTHWMVDVSGPGARFRLFGPLGAPE